MSVPGSHYTDEQRRQAVIGYQVYGSLTHLERQYGIPQQTLSDWKQSEWWDQLSSEVRSEVRDQITATYTRLLQQSQQVIEERLTNGDAVLTKTGAVIRMPVKMRDAAITMAICFDKRQILMNQPTSISARAFDPSALRAWMAQQQGRVIESTATQQQDE